MKTIFVLLLLIISISYSKGSEKDSALVKEAEVYMKGAMTEADRWLEDLNKHGYALFFDQPYPPEFEKALFESMDSIQKQVELQKWIDQEELEFGKVIERAFFGILIVTKGKLLGYNPHGMQQFQEINPKELGFKDINQLYLKNIEGTYAYLMYHTKPAKKDQAEELIVLWLDNKNNWNFVSYKIDDDI